MHVVHRETERELVVYGLFPNIPTAKNWINGKLASGSEAEYSIHAVHEARNIAGRLVSVPDLSAVMTINNDRGVWLHPELTIRDLTDLDADSLRRLAAVALRAAELKEGRTGDDQCGVGPPLG